MMKRIFLLLLGISVTLVTITETCRAQNTTAANENTFAVIISNDGCLNWLFESSFKKDALLFKNLCETSLMIPEKHIHYVANPTLANIILEFDWLQKVLDAYGGDAKAIIYYAGPGASDEGTRESFILPADGDATDSSSGYSLSDLYELLGEMPSKSVMVFLDACFNGSKRDGQMIAAARGVKIKAKPVFPTGNIVVFSASQNDETAWEDEEHDHGLFTYNIVNAFKEFDGDISLGDLSQRVISSIKKKVIVDKGVSQTPTILASPEVGNKWKDWKFNQ